ncbi:MAG: SpaA isopeptide-forming pilin-related protein, partial [Oscillospiraceae bacterium]|nr:SpaA isopeptide-forming pilin-related protein [Oscillospiraceae bacterium]
AEAYVNDRSGQFEKTWEQMSDDEKDQVLEDLQTSTKNDAINQIKNALAAAASDDNARPIEERFVFVDSTSPNAIINEKNEIEKWDVPVNPDGSADLPDIPDHDEPSGGKNIIVGENSEGKTIYGDTIETNIGDEVHYQLSINAVNYERMEDGTVKQIKEYIIADYQNQNMEFVADKGLKVSVVKKDKDGNITATLLDQADYTSWVEDGYFFTNTEKTDFEGEVFNGTGGIVIPWIHEITAEEAETATNVTKRTGNKMIEGDPVYQRGEEPFTLSEDGVTYVDVNGHIVDDRTGYLLDDNGDLIPETETHYYASIYPNDVTILVDYYMTVTDTAVIDGAGNKNYSQYGVNYFEPTDTSYTPAEPDSPPEEPQEPTVEKEQDDATVFTYAIAIKKVDDSGNTLAGATFQLRGVTAVEKNKGWYKVSAYDHAEDAAFGTVLETDDKGILVVEGLPAKWAIEVMETEAPAGYNKMTENEFVQPVKTGEEMTTISTVTYTDEEGNVTESTTTTITYKNGSGTVVAMMVKIGDQIKYYSAEEAIQANEINEATFNNLIAKYTTVDETEVTAPDNIAEIKIVNNKGTELPSTGGIGTTIFYVVGAILVIGAGVILITRRRMDA